MPVETPNEFCYYYECSYGDFRLVYHIPINKLEGMVADGSIEEEALKDFPDGIDLDCNESDYEDFWDMYSYRPAADPEKVKGAFVALFNELEHWDTFKGSGVISASSLESLIEPVVNTLAEQNIPIKAAKPKTKPRTIQERREIQKAQVEQTQEINQALKKISLSDLKVDKPKTRQELKPDMTKGDSAESIFIQAQRAGRRKSK